MFLQMMRHASRSLRSFLAALVAVPTPGLPALASAAVRPGSGAPLIGFGESIVDFLTGPLAVVIVAIGICIAAISLVMGSRDGLMKAGYALGGGALLFGVRAVVAFIEATAG
jgi:type IV secretory pathway VirB2 component (pilin)